MNFGQTLFDWLILQLQPILLLGLVAIGVWLIIKREFSKFLPLVVLAIIAVLLVFNTTGVKDFLLNVGNLIIGAGG